MPKIFHAKKPTFESLALKRPSVASCVEAVDPINLVEDESNSSDGKIGKNRPYSLIWIQKSHHNFQQGHHN